MYQGILEDVIAGQIFGASISNPTAEISTTRLVRYASKYVSTLPFCYGESALPFNTLIETFYYVDLVGSSSLTLVANGIRGKQTNADLQLNEVGQ